MSQKGDESRGKAIKLLGFLVTVGVAAGVLAIVGLVTGNTSLTSVAAFGLALLTVPLLVLAGSIVEALTASIGLTEARAHRVVRSAASLTIAALFFVMVLSVLPARLNLGLSPLVVALLLLLALTNVWLFNQRVIAVVAMLIFVGVTVSLVFPQTFERGVRGVRRIDAPRRVEISLEQIEEREVQFFLADGSPNLWFSVDSEQAIEWWDAPGVHPVFRIELQDASREAVEEFIRKLEGERARRNGLAAASERAAEEGRLEDEATRREEATMARLRQAQAQRERYFNLSEVGARTAVVIAREGLIDSTMSQYVADRLGGTSSFFKGAFVSEGLFAEVHSGQTEGLVELGMTRLPDQLVLGVADLDISKSRSRPNLVRVEATLRIRRIDVTAQFRSRAVEGLGIAARFSEEEATLDALQLAADEALGRLRAD